MDEVIHCHRYESRRFCISKKDYDVVVVGAGNAALCAALAARESDASVLILERAPESQKGGNSRYTAGAMRVVYQDANDLTSLMPELSDDEINGADFGNYTREQFYDDMGRITQYRSDPDLTELLIENSLSTLQWMNSRGVRSVSYTHLTLPTNREV